MEQVPTRWSHHPLPLLKQRRLKAVTRVETVSLVSRHQLLHRLQYHTQLQPNSKEIVHSRLHPMCATHDEYLVFITEQNLVGTDAIVSAVMLSSHYIEIQHNVQWNPSYEKNDVGHKP